MLLLSIFFFFKQKTAYEMRISDWSSDVCSSDLLYTILHRRGHYRLNGNLLLRIGRQLIAAAIMAAALLAAREPLLPWFAGSVVERALSVLALVLAGVVVCFGAAWTIGALARNRMAILTSKRAR